MLVEENINLITEMIWYFRWSLHNINRTLHGYLEIQNFSTCVQWYFTGEGSNTQREISNPHAAIYNIIFYVFNLKRVQPRYPVRVST